MLHVVDFGDEQCFSRCSLPGVMSLMAASLKLSKVNSCNDVDRSISLPSVLETRDDGANESTL